MAFRSLPNKTHITSALAVLVAGSLLLDARADITTGLVGFWKLDEGSGSAAADSSGSSLANNGTLTNFADAGFTTMWTSGWTNNAVSFNQYDENTNYVVIPDSTSLNAPSVNKQWTLAAWVKPSVAGSSQPNDTGLICKGTFDKEAFVMSLYQGKVRAKMRNAAGTGGFSITSTTALKVGTWYHVVATCMVPKGTNNSGLIVYVNGARETGSDANTYTTLYTSSQPMTIGTRANSSGTLLGFQGAIDDVRVYSRLLSPDDIFQLYTNSGLASAYLPVIAQPPRSVTCYSNDTAVFSVGVDTSKCYQPVSYQWTWYGTNLPGATAATLTLSNVTSASEGAYAVVVTNYSGAVTSAPAALSVRSLPAADTTRGLVGWWKFDDASGSSTAADSSGNGNVGALTNFTDTTFLSQWVVGVIGGALSFNGDTFGSNVVAFPGIGTPAPSELDFNASPVFTLSAWVKGATTQTNGAGIIAKGTGNGGEQYCVDINGGKYRFFVRDMNGVSYNITSAVTVNGDWQHVVAMVNATNGLMNLYVNGVLAGFAAAPYSLLANSHELTIGNRQAGTTVYANAFSGALDDVRVYNRDLTSADVFALYIAGINLPPTAMAITNLVAFGLTAKIALADLRTAAAWSDPEGDPVTLSGAGPVSANGASVTVDATYLYYNGPVTTEDHFNYSLTDGFQTANATLYLKPTAATAVPIQSPGIDGSGHPTFNGSGIPGYTYGVESTQSLTPPITWSHAGTVTVGANGKWAFTDLANTPPVYYRLYYPSNPGNPPQ